MEPTLTVLLAHDRATNKRFYRDASGQIAEQPYQNAYTFAAYAFAVPNIRRLYRLLKRYSRNDHAIIIRGLHKHRSVANTWRVKETFPEHADGTPWVMIDFDSIELPEGLSPISPDAIRWAIANRLPSEFHDVTCIYQFSNSAGILNDEGQFRKTGLRAHLFYFLDRRVPGPTMAAYLRQHCLDTDFYSIGPNSRNVVGMKYGIDPSPIRTATQPHYIAHPQIEDGIVCQLPADQREGLIVGSAETVLLPLLAPDILASVNQRHYRLLTTWKREHGYERHVERVATATGFASTTVYRPPTGNAGEVRTGRVLVDTNVASSGQYCRLFFEDEGTPGSWYVAKRLPQIARRYGDGETIALRELSDSAYAYVRDKLRWFWEVPQQNLVLDTNGFLPAFSTFMTARHSLLVAPTGCGKTHAAITWMEEQSRRAPVIYVAQTIPLVDQMREDLQSRQVRCYHYRDNSSSLLPWDPPSSGVIVTTNKSLPNILRLYQGTLSTYRLVIDEVHIALDDFLGSTFKEKLFEDAIKGARKVIYMTGTLTEMQRNMLAGILTRNNGGVLDGEYFCGYDFASVNEYPLHIRDLSDFQSDVVALFRRIAVMKAEGTALPRVALLLSTSRMETYRQLGQSFGLTEDMDIVSRPETTPEDINRARLSNKAILVASPLFSVGLNLPVPPDILWCRFDHLDADTNRIVQTINRANRTATECQVSIYVGVTDESTFQFPVEESLRQEFEQYLRDEVPVAIENYDWPRLLNRLTYQTNREVEKNPTKALGHLIRDDAFQNYRITDDPIENKVEATADDLDGFKVAKKQAKLSYEADVQSRLKCVGGSQPISAGIQFAHLDEESRIAWKYPDTARVPRELEHDELAIIRNLCQLPNTAKAKKVNRRKLQVLFGDREPWISDPRNTTNKCQWVPTIAIKLRNLKAIAVLLGDLRANRCNGHDVAARMTRGTAYIDGFSALAITEKEYLDVRRQYEQLVGLRELARRNGTDQNRTRAKVHAQNMTVDLLEAIGVFFPVEGRGANKVIRFDQPAVPPWDFQFMAKNLERRAQMFEDLPSGVKEINRNFDPDRLFAYPAEKCFSCKFFAQGTCALGERIDWSEIGIAGLDPEVIQSTCQNYRAFRGGVE